MLYVEIKRCGWGKAPPIEVLETDLPVLHCWSKKRLVKSRHTGTDLNFEMVATAEGLAMQAFCQHPDCKFFNPFFTSRKEIQGPAGQTQKGSRD